MRSLSPLLVAVALSGCATSFTGAAKVKDGPKGCKAACDAWGLDFAGMVKMGEYSDGCICQVKPLYAPQPAQPAPAPSASSGGTALAPAVGVFLQMQAAAAAAAQQGSLQHATQTGAQPGHWPYPGYGPPGLHPGMR